MYHSLFIPLSTSGHLGYFQFGAIMNKVAFINTHMQVFIYGHNFQIIWVNVSAVARSCDKTTLPLEELPNCVPKLLYHFTFPSAVN